ncbi:4'-phosphopantetheinyl transferase superfamily protein [Evansella sp. AB-rgal1]|uniref:4'-phosphopantetheinyl transferase family protein n=1 Tax=Evansella sp. AB-rgal1 TaxID=3242696 RepID=UPI00359E7C01
MEPNELHIWTANLADWSSEATDFIGILSNDERMKAERFLFERDRNYYVVGRYLLRKLIGSYLQLPIESKMLSYGEFGKPFIDPKINKMGLCFNLSHSKDMIVFIFTLHRSVGIDIEYTKKRYTGESIIKRWFSVRERSLYHSLSETERKEYFYLSWTAKEAFVKGTGKGIAIPFNDIELVNIMKSVGGERKYHYYYQNPKERDVWEITPFVPTTNYIGSYAIQNEGRQYTLKTRQLIKDAVRHVKKT